MRTLPYDFHRCQATSPDDKCRGCMRWRDLPGQTFGHWQSFVARKNSTDEHCSYIPIKEVRDAT